MKKIIATLLFCGIFLPGFSQPNFGYYYTTTPGASGTVRPIITRCPDGSIIGTSTSAGGIINTFSLFKIDMNGAMLWQEDITFGYAVETPTKVSLLSDGNIAILTKQLTSGSHFIIIKADLSGNVLWAKKFIPPPGTNALDMDPYSNGGMMVTFHNLIVFIDGAGNVDNAYDYGNFLIWEAEANPSGTYTVWGGLNVSSPDFFIFTTDPSGMVSNYYSLFIGPDTCFTGSNIPHFNVSKIPSGGSYCMFQLKAATGAYRFGVFRFDGQNQPVWAQKVTTTSNVYPRTINVCKDSGCLVTGQLTASNESPPLVFKFDSAGNSSWVKKLGWWGAPAWSGYDLLTVVPDTGTGWYCTLSKDKNHLFHTDSAFNGFCVYNPVQPVITTLPVTPAPQTVTTTPVTVNDSVLQVIVQPRGHYRYDACSGVLIDSATAVKEFYASEIDLIIFPVPAQNELTVSGVELSTGDVLQLSDITGKAVVTKTISQPATNLKLQTSNLANGMYLLTAQTRQGTVVRKVVIAH
ncbi:MAG TPA: T9SS type A sorting domain-containing protein [Bacteroidia bacterium]|nr:T9SS type A sorting domain-containing protein [Bacteroidia bacterium]